MRSTAGSRTGSAERDTLTEIIMTTPSAVRRAQVPQLCPPLSGRGSLGLILMSLFVLGGCCGSYLRVEDGKCKPSPTSPSADTSVYAGESGQWTIVIAVFRDRTLRLDISASFRKGTHLEMPPFIGTLGDGREEIKVHAAGSEADPREWPIRIAFYRDYLLLSGAVHDVIAAGPDERLPIRLDLVGSNPEISRVGARLTTIAKFPAGRERIAIVVDAFSRAEIAFHIAVAPSGELALSVLAIDVSEARRLWARIVNGEAELFTRATVE